MRVRVKLCGVTNLDDGLMAAAAGVDALGFIFAASPRRISPEAARRIIRALPPFVKTVGVFVDEAVDEVERIMLFCGLDMVQLHGDESPDLCGRLMPRSIKAVQVQGRSSLDSLQRYRGRVRGVVLDAWSAGRRGGIGRPFDWGVLQGVSLPGPMILAGGLGPENVREAVLAVRPYGIDINSGVESQPGRKDPARLAAVMRAIAALPPTDGETA